MGDILTKGSLLPEKIVNEMFSLVRGHSSLAALAAQEPIPFNGAKEFTFTLDKEADIVAENGAKSNGGATVAPVTIVPLKFEYGTRVSDEFLYGTEEYQLNILSTFADGAAKKFARGLDLAALHGVNPRTGAASAVVGSNNFDSKVENVAAYSKILPDATIESALALIETDDAQANGIALSPKMRSAIAAMETSGGGRKYPEFAFGANPGTMGGMKIDVNGTVNRNSAVDMAILGDFSAFKWGYAKNIPLEVIQYGNPDNDAELGDLKGHNQVYLRAEAYIGWGILAPDFFAIVRDVAALTLASAEGASSGKTAITVTETKGTGNIYKYYVGDTATAVVYGQDVSGGTTWDGTADITAATGKVLTLVEATSTGKALKVGTVTVTAHA